MIPLGAGPDGLSLRALRPLPDIETLLLHCRGIEVGRLSLPAGLQQDEVSCIPVTRLPRVPLPAELRVSTARDGRDLTRPWRLDSAAAALTLLGPPEIRIEDLRLDHGVLRGTAREPRNGLLEPVLYARINGSGARMVGTEPPIGLPEGGCAFRFALPIHPADLTESGLSVTLLLVGQEAPVGSFAWARQEAGPAERRLVELEGRLRQLEEETAAAQQGLQAAMERRLALQQERIDAFIAAASTLLFDRLAGAPASGEDALRSLLADSGAVAAGDPLLDRLARRVELPLDSGLFGAGWHREEVYPHGAFRWMGPRSLLLNPVGDRDLVAVTLEISALYRAAAPAITAALDEAAAEVAVTPCGPDGFVLRLAPPGGPRPVRLLRLDSQTGGCPAEEGESGDRRLLAAAVSRIVFEYAG
ncbi:hypothetical protein [Roseicella frigidaeris]|uniref:hypothetical protein n=1 Tax=Roseicella frigidaeris TaxID=2230885 RepID=UPI000FDD5D1D|nr:hypothetical protein [Roseicella frigidaeris]